MNVPASSSKNAASSRTFVLLAVVASMAVAGAMMAATDREHHVEATADNPRALRFTFENGSSVEYVGMFSADAKFRRPSRFNRISDGAASGHASQHSAPQRMLRFNERAIESFAPPAHATATPEVESPGRQALDGVVTLAYGHLRVMQAPQSLTTDSLHRVIVTDPEIPAVHVLDPRGKSSFRIVGGPGQRIQSADHVDVDAEDNIYVADSTRGLVLVFDRYGRFLRDIGTFRGESLFDRITAIAIDREARHLYLADGPRHEIVMLDLQGNVLKRVGQGRIDVKPGELIRRDPLAPQEFNYPTDIAVGAGKVAVLDSGGTRVRIMDGDCKLLGAFIVQRAAKDRAYAIAVDARGNIYVSYPNAASIRVYRADGQMVGAFGYAGFRMGQFLGPEGLWIDSANRLYVADTGNARVDLFQLVSPR